MRRKIFLVIVSVCLPNALAAKEPLRYVSLAPATTEILYAIGAGDGLAGVTSFCDYPPEARSKEIVGSFSQPNIEKILSLAPDMVFCTGLEQQPAIDALRRFKITVCVSDPRSLEELYASILEIGKKVGRQRQAEALVERMRKDVELVRSSGGKGKRPRVFAEIWDDPLMTAGKGSFVDELITIAGGDNIGGDTVRPYCRFSEEEVVAHDPDIILFLYPLKMSARKTVEGRKNWHGIGAVLHGRIYSDIDQNILIRPGPRLVEGLRALKKKIEEAQ